MIADGIVEVCLKRAISVTRDDRNCAVESVCGREVQFAVAGEVTHHYGSGTRAGDISDRWLESAVAISEQHLQLRAIAVVRHGQIEVAIPIEIALGERSAVVRRDGQRRCELAIAGPEKEGNRSGTDGSGRGHKVRYAIPIEVSHGQIADKVRRLIDGRLKSAIAVAEQYRKTREVSTAVYDSQIQVAIPVEVARDDEEGKLAGGGCLRSLESSVAISR